MVIKLILKIHLLPSNNTVLLSDPITSLEIKKYANNRDAVTNKDDEDLSKPTKDKPLMN